MKPSVKNCRRWLKIEKRLGAIRGICQEAVGKQERLERRSKTVSVNLTFQNK